MLVAIASLVGPGSAQVPSTFHVSAKDAAAVSKAPAVQPPVVTALAISADGETLASAGDDHCIDLWNLSSGSHWMTLRGHGDWVRAVAFLPAKDSSGDTIYSAGQDGRILAWDLSRREGRTVVHLHRAWSDLKIDPTSGDCIGVGFGSSLWRHPLDSSKSILRLSCPCRDMRSVAISPDGQYIAAGGRNGKIRVWSSVDGQVVRDIQTHDQPLRVLLFAPDSQRIISAGEDRALCVWSIANGEELRHIQTHTGRILSAAVLDDHRLAVGTSENEIPIWDLRTGTRLHTLTGHTGSVGAMVSRGDRLVSGSYDATIRIWSVPVDGAPVPLAVLDTDRKGPIRR